MDPPAFQKARQRSLEEEYKKEIVEKLAAMPQKEKMEKIPWEEFKENLNIPEQIIQKQVRGMERELQQARQRYEEDSYSNYDDNSFHTEKMYEQSESEREQGEKEGDDIDSQEIDRFILNEEERKIKKNIWIQHNSAWLEKERAKAKEGEKVEKKRTKKKLSDKANTNVFEAIRSTKLGEKVNPEELKTLLGSSPQEPSKTPLMKLDKIFDPYALDRLIQ